VSVATLKQTRKATDEIRRRRKAMQRAQTEISLYTNNPDGSPGLVYRGHLDVNEAPHNFPDKKNVSSAGQFTVRANHYLAKMIARIPNDPDECKNVIVRVQRYGGAWQWTGMMHHWKVFTKDGVDYLQASFNDDKQVAQFTLGPPNPLLPIPIFQGPRDWFQFGPGAWTCSSFFWLQVVRNQIGEATLAALTIPDDPFDIASWADGIIDSLLPSQWQVHVKCNDFLSDSSLWTFIGSRMNTVDSVIADALDDGQMVLRYRRYFTDEGDTVTGLLDNNIANGALVFWIDDESGLGEFGTFFGGTAIGGLERSIVTWAAGGLEDTLSLINDDQSLYPDEFWQSGFMGQFASAPTVGLEDSWFHDLQSEVTHSPATASKVIVGGDNPTADAIAKLIIESVGNLVGYFLLGGFDSLGDIVADVVMPFIVGTILAWDEWTNVGRKSNIGWVHLWEIYQQGAENNNWSLSAVAAMRGGFKNTEAKTSHTMVVDESSWFIPGLHATTGDRFWSTSGALQRMGIDLRFINQIEEMTLSGDDTGYARFLIKCGQNKAAMSQGERNANLLKKVLSKLQDVGVRLIS
jgi:hypothetical protein